MKNFEQAFEPLIDSFSGATGGVIASLIFYPIENFRTRVQAQDSHNQRNQSLIQFFNSIWKEEGFLSFYKGLKMALVGTVASYGIYFWWYRALKNIFANMLKRTKFNNSEMTLITAIAGSIASVFANPIWMLNTRLTI